MLSHPRGNNIDAIGSQKEESFFLALSLVVAIICPAVAAQASDDSRRRCRRPERVHHDQGLTDLFIPLGQKSKNE